MDNNHLINWDEAKIIGKKRDRYKRWIKEAIAIKKQGTFMNRDEGQYQLSHVFDDLLGKKDISIISENNEMGGRRRERKIVYI